jgi:hypothetical protein
MQVTCPATAAGDDMGKKAAAGAGGPIPVVPLIGVRREAESFDDGEDRRWGVGQAAWQAPHRELARQQAADPSRGHAPLPAAVSGAAAALRGVQASLMWARPRPPSPATRTACRSAFYRQQAWQHQRSFSKDSVPLSPKTGHPMPQPLMTLPNILTFLRLILVPVVFVLMWVPREG